MVPYLFISILSTWSSYGSWLLSVLAPAGLVQFPAGVCHSVRKLHPRGLRATRRTVADSRASPVKVRGGVFFNAPAQPMAQEWPLAEAGPLIITKQHCVLWNSVALRVKTDALVSTATFRSAQHLDELCSRLQKLRVMTILATRFDKDSKKSAVNLLNAPLKWVFCVIDYFDSARSSAAPASRLPDAASWRHCEELSPNAQTGLGGAWGGGSRIAFSADELLERPRKPIFTVWQHR